MVVATALNMVDHNSDHLVPKPVLLDLDSNSVGSAKKRRVNFNLTIDIKQESNDACVPQGPNSLSDYSDGESLSEAYVPIPTTPGGKPQVCYPKKIKFLRATFL